MVSYLLFGFWSKADLQTLADRVWNVFPIVELTWKSNRPSTSQFLKYSCLRCLKPLWPFCPGYDSFVTLLLWPRLNSNFPLLPMHHAASFSFYPCCLILSSVVLSGLILQISCPCDPSLSTQHTPPCSAVSPFPPLSSVHLFLFFLPPVFPPLWRSAMMQSQSARPCLITLIKHPMR